MVVSGKITVRIHVDNDNSMGKEKNKRTIQTKLSVFMMSPIEYKVPAFFLKFESYQCVRLDQ